MNSQEIFQAFKVLMRNFCVDQDSLRQVQEKFNLLRSQRDLIVEKKQILSAELKDLSQEVYNLELQLKKLQKRKNKIIVSIREATKNRIKGQGLANRLKSKSPIKPPSRYPVPYQASRNQKRSRNPPPPKSFAQRLGDACVYKFSIPSRSILKGPRSR